MNWDLLFRGLNAAALIASGVLNFWLWHKSKADARFNDLEERLEEFALAQESDRESVRMAIAERKAHVAELTESVAVINERMKILPTHDDLRGLVVKLSAVEERSQILLDGMRRIENHLLDR